MASPSLKLRWTIFASLALLALAVRLPQLGVRPMHTDEAINAYIMGQLLAGQAFHYDPHDRHGPALAAATLPLVKLEGAKDFAGLTEAGLRLSPVLAGTITVLLFGAGVEMFGFVGCVMAGLIFALAPLPVYYNRYFIHESWFVAATLGLVFALWQALRQRSVLAAALAGCCGAFMLAGKETAPLHFFCLALAFAICWLLTRQGNSVLRAPSLRIFLTALLAFLVASILLFTWFGRNWGVFSDLMQAVPNFANRAGGEGHEKPFWYYSKLLAGGWSGAVLIVGTMLGMYQVLRSAGSCFGGGDAAAAPQDRAEASPLRFILAVYGAAIFLIYSLIPYKTPWLALNFYPVMTVMCGIAFQMLWFACVRFGARIVMLTIVVGAGFLMAHDTRERVFMNPADPANPYAYAHTVDDLLGLPTRVAELVHEKHLANPRIAVVAADAWPLPWYLRNYSQVGFWQPGQDPGPADFYITSPEAAAKMGHRLDHYQVEYFGLRPDVLIFLWVPEQVGKSK